MKKSTRLSIFLGLNLENISENDHLKKEDFDQLMNEPTISLVRLVMASVEGIDTIVLTDDEKKYNHRKALGIYEKLERLIKLHEIDEKENLPFDERVGLPAARYGIDYLVKPKTVLEILKRKNMLTAGIFYSPFLKWLTEYSSNSRKKRIKNSRYVTEKALVRDMPTHIQKERAQLLLHF